MKKMVFNSFAYLAFFLAFAAVYFLFPPKFRWTVVLAGNYFFYMSWRPIYGLLLLATTFLDWLLALWMVRYAEREKQRRVLIASITVNLGVLFFFKYFNFFADTVSSIIHYDNALMLQILLPIGISFYTFQSMAYMIDVFRGKLPAEKHFGRYAAFVSFFPHLVSGPILQPANIIPQLHEDKRWNIENFKAGLYLIGTGLFKKIIIADRLAFFVNNVYDRPHLYSGATLLLATYFFAFQIYCDFAGYTDIAIGSARVLGYQIPDNFRQPYFSESIPDFWRRWHMSLSSWLRDYLYIPLGGNRFGKFNTYKNLMITMVLGGLWHGAAWTFIIWGFLHGAFLAASKITQGTRDRLGNLLKIPPLMRNIIKYFVTFNLVCLAWIFFRAQSLRDATVIIKKIFTDFGELNYNYDSGKVTLYIVMIGALLLFDWLESRRLLSRLIASWRWPYQWSLALVLIFVFIFAGVQTGAEFIYFQF